VLPATLQTNYRNAQQEIIFHYPARVSAPARGPGRALLGDKGSAFRSVVVIVGSKSLHHASEFASTFEHLLSRIVHFGEMFGLTKNFPSGLASCTMEAGICVSHQCSGTAVVRF